MRGDEPYDDVVLFLLTYHGVLAHQTRDMFSAGSGQTLPTTTKVESTFNEP